MKIKWYGHSCFGLEFSGGLRVVTDPFDDHVGYPLCEAYADIVTISHGHSDHSYAASVQGLPTVLNRAGAFDFGDLQVKAVKSFHDAENGALRGDNLIFIYEADGLKLAHLGDLGHEPDAQQYAALEGTDVLMIPIGGYYTIDTDTALRAISRIRPRIVIPMHFKTPVMDFPISDEKQFAEARNAVYMDGTKIEIAAENIGSLPGAVILKYA